MVTMSNLNVQMLEHRRTIEANQANVYEFHLPGVIDMSGKLQKKKLDAEMPDAQEGENNATPELVGTLSPDDSGKGPQNRARLVAEQTKRNSDLTADDASERMALAAAVQEELEFMRQLKDDLVLKGGEPEEFEAYRLLLRRYKP